MLPAMSETGGLEPFTIDVPDAVLEDLRDRSGPRPLPLVITTCPTAATSSRTSARRNSAADVREFFRPYR
jgi:hypothetical protein